jgi:hypothetical protein
MFKLSRKAPAPLILAMRCREIRPPDLESLIDLLTTGFWRHPRGYWAGVIQRLTDHPTPDGFPKYGYMLENDGNPVGALLMIVTARRYNGTTRVWCNESSYYVEPHFRCYASLLVKRAHRRKDVTYLDLTPSPHTWTTLNAQGYKRLAEGVYATIPALCRPTSGAKIREVRSHCEVRSHLDGYLDSFDLDLLVAHASYGLCLSVICEQNGIVHPFVFALRHKYGMPYAYLIYTRSLADFVTLAGTLGRYLARRGFPAVVLDADGPIGGLPGKYMEAPPKFWLGGERPRLGDLAYTEIAMFAS